MKKHSTLWVAQGALIAAIYVVVTLFISAFNLASGAIQVRLSEALCILPVFTSSAIPGLTIGCFLSNLITGGVVWDMIFGTLATLIGAVGTYVLRKHKYLSLLPPIVSNSIIIPLILKFVYGMPLPLHVLIATVFIGEFISIGVVGSIFRKALEIPAKTIFKDNLA